MVTVSARRQIQILLITYKPHASTLQEMCDEIKTTNTARTHQDHDQMTDLRSPAEAATHAC